MQQCLLVLGSGFGRVFRNCCEMYGMMLSSIVLVWFLYLKQTQLHVLRVVIIVYGLLISD